MKTEVFEIKRKRFSEDNPKHLSLTFLLGHSVIFPLVDSRKDKRKTITVVLVSLLKSKVFTVKEVHR